jgi:hypothetical protein
MDFNMDARFGVFNIFRIQKKYGIGNFCFLPASCARNFFLCVMSKYAIESEFWLLTTAWTCAMT